MADLSKMLSHMCPNICKECQPQCRKWQEISNLEGLKLIKYIKTQQEIASKEGGSPPHKIYSMATDSTSSSEPSPSQRNEHRPPSKEYPRGSEYRPEAKMITCCKTCDTILQQISILLCEIWDILEPQRRTCDHCRLTRHIKCSNCQQTSTYSSPPYTSGFSMESPKDQFISWLTKLRHTLLAVLEGATKSTCKIYKGEPKDELEKLLQELRFPLQKQARDIRITSLTKTPLSSTERDESLVASLIENTELLERVLAKIKVEGYKIEMKIREAKDRSFQAQSNIGRLPELKPYYKVGPSPSHTSTPSDNIIIFPPIPVKAKSKKNELKIDATNTKEDRMKQNRDDASKEDKMKQNRYDASLKQDKGKDFSHEISPTKSMRDPSKERKEHQSGATYTKDASMKKDHGESFPNEKLKKSVKDTISKEMTPLTTKKLRDKENLSRLSSRSADVEKSKSLISPTAKKARKSKSLPEKFEERVTKGKEHAEIDWKNKKEVTREKIQETRTKVNKQHSDIRRKGRLPVESEPTRGDKFESNRSIKAENRESPQRKSIIEDKSSIRDKSRDKDLGKQHKIKHEKFKNKGSESNMALSKVRIKEGLESKSTRDSISIDERPMNKKKGKKTPENLEPLPTDKETYTRRHTVQVPSKIILKKMRELKVEELRKKRRAQRMTDVKMHKLKSLKSLPNLELIREKQRLRRRKRREADESGSDTNIVECASALETLEMIRGNVIVPHASLSVEDFVVEDDGDVKPILFKVKADMADDAYLGNRFESVTALRSQKSLLGKGVIEYKLSNPKFIELGYTKLPTVSVMRKSLIYKMEQPHPEEDWFRRHVRDGILFYDTCEKLAEVDDDGHGRWYYKNGRIALNYSAAEEKDARNRYIVYSSGENDASGNPRCDTVLASFDHLGNGIVYDHCGNVRLKYNQNEGENFDKTIAPTGRWKWHSLNTSLQSLQNVYLEQRVKLISNSQLDLMEEIANQGSKITDQFAEMTEYEAEEHKNMLTIEMNNFCKEKNRMQQQKYQPFQLKMKAFKLNEQFSLRIYEQRKVYIYFNTGTRRLKLNLGLRLATSEILGTETVNLREILTPFDRHIPPSDSIANILDIVGETRKKTRKKKGGHKGFYSDIKNTSTRVGVDS